MPTRQPKSVTPRKRAGTHAGLRACYLGVDDALGRRVRESLAAAGYQFEAPDLSTSTPDFDLIIDNASSCPADVRAILLACRQPTHYVLVSSYRVYAPVPTLRPWREDDAGVMMDQTLNLPPDVMAARAVERELHLLAAGRFGATILRPTRIEDLGRLDDGEIDLTAWFATRIRDGGLLVLPAGDLPSYRLLGSEDLAAAITLVAQKPATGVRTINVAGSSLVSYWGHAAMTRDGLRGSLRFAYVPRWRWRAAGLALPFEDRAWASLIAPSLALHELGWHAADPVSLVTRRAAELADPLPAALSNSLALERRVLAEDEGEGLYQPGQSPLPLAEHNTAHWALRAWTGQPASLTLERLPAPAQLPAPRLMVRALTLLAPEERLMRGEYPQRGHRLIGHNALLEVLDDADPRFPSGSFALPMSVMPCDDKDCVWCRDGRNGVLGIGCDGYGLGICTTPRSHLLASPPGLGLATLLADPLACLMVGLRERLVSDDGPVWIGGRTIDAALASWLIQDLGRPVLHVDRRAWAHPEFPTQAVTAMLEESRQGQRSAPTLVLDFTGSSEVSWALGQALTPEGHLFVRRRPTGVPHGKHWHELPAAAPNRAALDDALERLQRWSRHRDLDARIGPAVPLDLYWDVLLPTAFCLPYLEAGQ